MFRPSGFGVSAGHLSNTLEGCFFFRADGERKSVLVLNIPSSGVGRLRPARTPLLCQILQTSSSCKDVQVKMSVYVKLRQHFDHVQVLGVTSAFKCKSESPNLSFGHSWNCNGWHTGYVHTVSFCDWQPHLLTGVSLEMSCSHSSIQLRL